LAAAAAAWLLEMTLPDDEKRRIPPFRSRGRERSRTGSWSGPTGWDPVPALIVDASQARTRVGVLESLIDIE
jgi:hypothetical protein